MAERIDGSSSMHKAHRPAPAAQLSKQVEIPDVSFLYRFALAVVAVAIILLPLVYVGLIMATAWGVYRMATHVDYLFASRQSGPMLALMYFTPLIVGMILLFFMVKPLLARQSQSAKRYSLDRSSQPKFFEFAERIAEMVGSPTPSRIDVDCDVNAAAGFRRGLLSFFGRDLVLTVGLPLVSGLSMRQLGGILAHEFGHFGQGTGMRLSYLIRLVNNWFIRVVYQRDAWDDRLVKWCNQLGVQFAIPLYLARAMIWLTRRVLWVLMYIGLIFSAFLMRQGEYDADLFQIAICGSDCFSRCFRKMFTLSVASRGAHSDLRRSWQERRLCDNLPALICANVGDIPAEALKDLHTKNLKVRTGLLDSHPCDTDRIRRAAAINSPGLIDSKLPAATLFSDYSSLSRHVTFDYYRQVIGPEVNASNLIPTESLVAQQKSIEGDRKAAMRYFQNLLTGLRPMSFGIPDGDGCDFDQVVKALCLSRQRMLDNLPDAQAALVHFEKMDESALKVVQAFALRKSGFRLPVSLQPPGGKTLEAHSIQVNTELRAAAETLDRCFIASAARLKEAIQLPYCQGATDRLPQVDDLRAEIKGIVPALIGFLSGYVFLQELRFNYYRMRVMLHNVKKEGNSEKLIQTIKQTANHCLADMRNLKSELDQCGYPFEHASGQISIGQYALAEMPASEHDIGRIIVTCEDVFERLYNLYYRMMGRLASMAERIESALGLPPLPDPPEKKAGKAQ